MTKVTKYRKKPVVVEAKQFNGLPDYLDIVKWARESGVKSVEDDFFYSTNIMSIDNESGKMTVNPGDYVIKGIEGEFYQCPYSVFMATYEEVVK